MNFPGTDDYLTKPFFDAADNNTSGNWVDAGEYAEIVDIIIDVSTVGTSWSGVLYQNDTSTDSGSATCSLPATWLTNTSTGQFKYRLVPGDAAGNWDGSVDGRYLKLVLSGSGTYNANAYFITHRSANYEVE